MKFWQRTVTTPRNKRWWIWMRPYVVLICLCVGLRLVLIAPVQLPNRQHALISLTYYGLRVPGETIWGYHRWGYRLPAHDDEVVFTCTDKHGNELTLTGRCHALPGETIWIDTERRIIIPGRTSPDAQPISIPGQQQSIKVTPHNARFLAFIMQQYEHCNSVKINKNGQLELDGQPISRVKLMRDYYWIEMQPDSFMIIPHDALVGKMIVKAKF